jgi:hypothetical protein
MQNSGELIVREFLQLDALDLESLRQERGGNSPADAT